MKRLDCYELFVYILSSNSKNNLRKLEINLNIKKFLSKFFKTIKIRSLRETTQSIFVPIYPPRPCPVFVYILKFFPSNSLGRAFLDEGYSKVCEVKMFLVNCSGMHGKGGVLPLFL